MMRFVPLTACLLSLLLTLQASAQRGVQDGQWPHYAGDAGSTKYTALDQITRDNFADLKIRWRWESVDKDLKEKSEFEPFDLCGTPLYVNGVIYMVTGMCQVAAIDANYGETLWVHDPESYAKGRIVHSHFRHRGLEYWTDGQAERIFLATGGCQLVSVDAKTGRPDPNFGKQGVVDLTRNLGRRVSRRDIGHSAPVVVCRDTVIMGSLVNDFTMTQKNPPGHIRGYDVRTGEFKWRFNSIPQAGEFGNNTWENDSWKYTGNTNVWSMISCDHDLGYVYLPFGTPTNDYYGGHRHGDNLFGESLVCLNAETGERVWHFQAVHHGIWDYDFPCAPNLIDINVDGKPIKAVAQVSKQAFTYVFDRVTGEPVWPIEERAVAASPVETEKLSPTQPFPTKPAPFDRQGISEDDLIDFTPQLRKQALENLKHFVPGPIFSPLTRWDADGTKGTVVLPGAVGGANWPGASVDPETGILYVASETGPNVMSLVKPDASRSDFDLINNWGGGSRLGEGLDGLPIIKPPYRRITAIDMNNGEHVWQIPFGDGPREHPAIKHLKLGPLGTQFPRGVLAEGGILLTKTLLITFLPRVDELGDRRARGSLLQAYDKATGELLHSIPVERTLHGSPMSCLHEGRQYIVIAGGGRDEPAELVAFGLPE